MFTSLRHSPIAKPTRAGICVRSIFGGIALAFSLPAAADISSAFVAGDRWAVLGDSITHTGPYHREIELFYLTRQPAQSLDVINCGAAGDTAAGTLRRLDWDCLAARPTVVSVMLGMNDISRDLYAPNKTGAEMTAKVEARIAKGSSNPWVVNQNKLYLEVKPHEAELPALAAAALAEARTLAQPRPHRFTLTAVVAPAPGP